MKENKVKILALTSILAVGILEFEDYLSKEARRVINRVESKIVKENYKINNFSEIYPSPDLSDVELTNRDTIEGKIQRAYRWKGLTDYIEKKELIPSGTLLAMAIIESYGNPIQLNYLDDGGFGLIHLQGNVAKRLGLKIFGNSKKYKDYEHGLELREMVRDCNYNLYCIALQDERANPFKNLDTTVKLIKEGMKNSVDWDKGIMYFRGGSEDTKKKYLEQVHYWRNIINDSLYINSARTEFQKINPELSFEDYIYAFHQYANSFCY